MERNKKRDRGSVGDRGTPAVFLVFLPVIPALLWFVLYWVFVFLYPLPLFVLPLLLCSDFVFCMYLNKAAFRPLPCLPPEHLAYWVLLFSPHVTSNNSSQVWLLICSGVSSSWLHLVWSTLTGLCVRRCCCALVCDTAALLLVVVSANRATRPPCFSPSTS